MSHPVNVDPKSIRIFHVENKETIACELNHERKVIAWATAKVHPKDQFCRKTGRIKAIGRLHSANLRIVEEYPQLFEDFRQDMYLDIVQELHDQAHDDAIAALVM